MFGTLIDFRVLNYLLDLILFGLLIVEVRKSLDLIYIIGAVKLVLFTLCQNFIPF